MNKKIDFYNLEEVKTYLEAEKDIDYVKLFERYRPVNHDYIHNRMVTPIFEYLLENGPDLWQDIIYKDNYFMDKYLWEDKESNTIHLAGKVIGIVNHYAEDKYWRIFVQKLKKDIQSYDEENHKKMWKTAILHYTPIIFSSFDMTRVIEENIGEEKAYEMYLENIEKLNWSGRHHIDIALSAIKPETELELIKNYLEKEDFFSLLTIQDNSYNQSMKKLKSEDILKIEINNESLKDYFQNKETEYVKNITGKEVQSGSYNEIDDLFRKNSIDSIHNRKEHNYKLNYFNLLKYMKLLDIQSLEYVTEEKQEVKKPKIK